MRRKSNEKQSEEIHYALMYGPQMFDDDEFWPEQIYGDPSLYPEPNPRRKLLQFVLGLCLICSLLVVAAVVDGKEPKQEERNPESANNTYARETQVSVPVALPTFDGDVLLCSKGAKQAYDGTITIAEALPSGMPYRPFLFRYGLVNQNGVLLLSEDPAFTNVREYALQTAGNVLEIDNLKVATKYYYKVLVGGKEYRGDFRTAESTRFVRIPGLYNTRDIGGYTTLDGKTVKQGLLIRGTELDGLVSPTYVLSINAREEVQKTFGFVYDMDLREEHYHNGFYQSPLGADVGHKFYNTIQYGQIFDELYKHSLKQIFTDLADPDKYPMYMHCTWGKDRTGTVIFLLQSILNVSLEDMYYEYYLSTFDHPTMVELYYIDAVVYGVEGYEGDTIQEKIVSYLKSFVGVTDDEIESIRSIFLAE